MGAIELLRKQEKIKATNENGSHYVYYDLKHNAHCAIDHINLGEKLKILTVYILNAECVDDYPILTRT